MSNPFAAGVRLIFHNPHFRRQSRGIYIPQTGPRRMVSVIERHDADEVATLLGTGARQPVTLFDVQVSELPTRPVDGDTLTIDTVSYRIRQAEPDELGLVWQLDVEPL